MSHMNSIKDGRIGERKVKTTKELIAELSEYPDDLKWEAIFDEDEGFMLVSEYTGNITNAQVSINLEDDNA